MQIFRTFILILVLSVGGIAQGKILTITKLSEMWPEITVSDTNTLILFDAEDVLMAPLPEYNMEHAYRKKLISNYKEHLSEKKIDDMLSVILEKRKIQFVDPDTAEIFVYLKTHQIPATVLTKGRTKNYGVIPNMTDFRIKEIQTLGLNFHELSPFKEDMILPDMITDGAEKEVKTPLVKSGIIFSSRLNKASVLEVVLKKYNFYPKKIIFVDDKMKNIKPMEQLAKKLKIEFIGYEFTGSQNLPVAPINESEEDLCFIKLQNNGIWCH